MRDGALGLGLRRVECREVERVFRSYCQGRPETDCRGRVERHHPQLPPHGAREREQPVLGSRPHSTHRARSTRQEGAVDRGASSPSGTLRSHASVARSRIQRALCLTAESRPLPGSAGESPERGRSSIRLRASCPGDPSATAQWFTPSSSPSLRLLGSQSPAWSCPRVPAQDPPPQSRRGRSTDTPVMNAARASQLLHRREGSSCT